LLIYPWKQNDLFRLKNLMTFHIAQPGDAEALVSLIRDHVSRWQDADWDIARSWVMWGIDQGLVAYAINEHHAITGMAAVRKLTSLEEFDVPYYHDSDGPIGWVDMFISRDGLQSGLGCLKLLSDRHGLTPVVGWTRDKDISLYGYRQAESLLNNYGLS
jgi:hypothetical protein